MKPKTVWRIPYVYGTTNTGTGSQLAGPHAVTQANGYAYHYDRNGNLTTATKTGASTKSVVYSPFNTPTSISHGSKWSTIVYGPHQGRIKHSDSNGRVTKYVGGLYEEITHNGVTQKIHYVGNQILFVQKEGSSPSESYQFLHRDHIGSLVAITGSTVTTHADVQYLSNGAWGERRFEQWNGPLDDSFIPTGTARGFTDHEHLDSVGLIHMNGRVYDPVLGRFLSADSLIQAPHNTQSYNRYSYVFNNPLSFVDPSGYATEDIWVPGPSAAEREAAEQERRRQAMLDSYMQSLMEAASIDRMVDMYNNDKQREKLYLRLRHQSILGISTKGTVSQINKLSAQKGGNSSGAAFAILIGASGLTLDAIGGSAGFTSKGSFRFYESGWSGNQYMKAYKLASIAKPFGSVGFGVGVLNDLDALKRNEITEEKAALNTAMGALTYTRYGLVGLAYGVNDAYGENIGAGMIGAAIAIGPEVRSNISHPDRYNDLERAIKNMYR